LHAAAPPRVVSARLRAWLTARARADSDKIRGEARLPISPCGRPGEPARNPIERRAVGDRCYANVESRTRAVRARWLTRTTEQDWQSIYCR
jgi:hypothetical protein